MKITYDWLKDHLKTNKSEISDQAKYLADQKIEVLRSIN